MEPYPTRQAPTRIVPVAVNYRRGILFFRLAIEQVRTVNSASAERLLKHYLEPLESAFAHTIQSLDHGQFDQTSQPLSYQQHEQGATEWRSMEAQGTLPIAPPGFGLDTLGLKEALPSMPANKASAQGVQHERLKDYDKSLFSLEARVNQLNHYGGPNPGNQSLVPVGTGIGATNSGIGGTTSRIPSGSHLRRNDYGPIAPPKPSNVLAVRKATFNPYVSLGSNLPPGGSHSISKPDKLPEQSHQQSTTAPTPRLNRELPGGGVALPANMGRRPSGSTGESQVNQNSNTATSYAPRPSNQVVADPRRKDIVFGSFQGSVHAGVIEPGKVTEDSGNSNNSEECSPSRGTEPDPKDAKARAAEPVKAPDESKANVAKATTSSWAEIAAIPPPSESGCNPDISLTKASPTPRTCLPNAEAMAVAPKEPAAAQLRVVWLANLPRYFRHQHVSNHITEGPLLSILFQDNAHDSLPGWSACIIFMNATDATAFMEHNNHCPKTETRLGPSKYAHYFNNANDQSRGSTPANPLSIADLKRKDISIKKGIAYPMSADKYLEAMYPPSNARRRLKWSRRHLFYDVSMKQFKRDVYAIVGGKDFVEFFHFYNSGECTVVFASVSIAYSCLEAFEKMSQEGAPAGHSAFGLTVGQITTLEEEGRAGGFHPGRMDNKKGRYAGVDVTYVRDFNEARPEAFSSQYGMDCRPHAASRFEGCEGVFEGPDV